MNEHFLCRCVVSTVLNLLGELRHKFLFVDCARMKKKNELSKEIFAILEIFIIYNLVGFVVTVEIFVEVATDKHFV